MNQPLQIAVVGVGGRLPGAADLAAFWANVVAGRDAARDVPPDRWPINPALVLQPGPPALDKTYSLRGYFLDAVPRDPDVDPALDPLFHLAVTCARDAWNDARTAAVNRRRVGVVLGSIALPTERISAWNRAALTPLFDCGIESAIRDPQSKIRNQSVVGGPALIVADIFGLGGLCLTLDAACASSLYALKIACDELTSGRADLMLAGGLNRSDSLYTQMGFAQLRALSPSGRCAPLDAAADGLLVGEGGVVFALKRLDDAVRDGDRVHGVIAGIGLSNDRDGGLLAPASEGQLRAMTAAYDQAGWRPGDVDFIECHATGTPVGDAVELASLRALWTGETGRCALGATKANVGHLLTGAGAAALLKVLLALRHETLPPIANFRSWPADSPLRDGPFDAPMAARPWPRRYPDSPRRAAVNAFGFGGINAHVLVEEHVAAPPAVRGEPALQAPPRNRIAVVGIGAQFGAVSEIELPLDRLRTPPSELQASLPQQLLLLRVAVEALDDAGVAVDPLRIGAVVGIALDPNTTNYDFRWTRRPEERERAGPPLTAERVMGHLGSIAASRLARCFGFGGPSYTVSAEEASGLVALRLAVEALRRGELDAALVAAVDFPSDPRSGVAHPCDGAGAILVMPLERAERLGAPIYSELGGEASTTLAVDAPQELGDAGAASAMASIIQACRITAERRCATSVRAGSHEAVFSPPAQRLDGRRPPRVPGGRTLAIPVTRLPFPPRAAMAPALPPSECAARVAEAWGHVAAAHEVFLRFSARTNLNLAAVLAAQNAVLERMVTQPNRRGVFLDRAGCLEFAVGRIGQVLGSEFAAIDAFPTRVRLPDEPLMLVDRIISIEGEPRSLTRGRIVTEHDVTADRWYLERGVAPASIAIESGQADLFLSAYLGVDFHTRGRAVYRLLDAAVTFHRDLPRVGETVRYDIRIKEFFRQGETILFRFEFDGTIDGQPLLTMRDGCAGFFTPEELSAGRGIVQTEMQRRPRPGTAPPGWRAPLNGVESYSAEQLDGWRRNDRLPSQERLRLIHRVPKFDPAGGRFGLGLIRGEADIHPDDWFLTCHFVDDQVMPGTLMYECCLHTLRIALLRLGWDAAAWQPVLGVTSRLKCRGQVTAATRTVAYEVAIKRIEVEPEPFAIADAIMFADEKPIVEVQDMTLRLAAATQLEIRSSQSEIRNVVFNREQILEFATGSAAQAFGERYAPFESGRFIARLPAPPYSFIDRVVSATVRPWEMTAGGSATAEFDVRAEDWYFAAAGQPRMPYAVLLEAALQACGWVSAYVGSALHSDVDLHYRNLGGRGTILRSVAPDAGTLSTTVTLTKVSKSAGMIIQHFDFAVRDAAGRDVYVGDTYFGFFTAAALGEQVGLRDARPWQPQSIRPSSFTLDPSSLPGPMLRMIDTVDLWQPDGGPHGLGFICGGKSIDPREWFFQAHFRQDPVWPGSLGLEAFLQLLRMAATKRWGPATNWESPELGVEHRWTYRGQVLPSDRRVTVQAEITKIDDPAHALQADGWLLVDGRVIYQMKDFAFRHMM